MEQRDGLKPLDELLQPDVRHSYMQLTDHQTGESRPIVLADHYSAIEAYSLHRGVPHDVATQYDVARNIYLYAWFEYRFFNAAEANVLTVLEFAIKERIGKPGIKSYIKERKRQNKEITGNAGRVSDGMKTLIEYCRDHRLIRNEGFSAWHRQPRLKAEMEHMNAMTAEMSEAGEDSREIDYSSLDFPEPGYSYDHVQHLIDHTNKIRNIYAHGTSMLYGNVLYSFEMVAEFINQIYQENGA